MPYHTWLIPLLPTGLSDAVPIRILLWLVGYGTAGYVLDQTIFLLESIPGLNRLAGLNFTARARRYLAPDLPRREEKGERQKAKGESEKAVTL